CRQTGFAMLCSSSVQEVMDLALVAHLATLQSEIPFLHFFDGFRTSHEVNKIDCFEYEEMQSLLDEESIVRFRQRALSPDNPCARGTAQNPDVYFQNRESANLRYQNLPSIVQETMDKVAKITKRPYHVFDYFGVPDAEYVVVMMGSGCKTMEETIETHNGKGGKFGLITVRLYRPFDKELFYNSIPKTCKRIAVLDRTKEAGSLGEPLYADVALALKEYSSTIQAIGGRYGLGSKEFTPTCCNAVLQNLLSENPKNHFTVGIHDDVSHSSLDISKKFVVESDATACKFYGLGSDGTIGANKNSVKIIGAHTDKYVQAYFCYDSRKSGGVTVSHLRFGDNPIRSAYFIDQADFTACHNPSYLTRFDMLSTAKSDSIFLLNCPWENLDELECNLPSNVKRQIAEKNLKFFVIDATNLANEVSLRGRTSTIMQAVFFLLNPQLLPYEEALSHLKNELITKFQKKGENVVNANLQALDKAKERVKEIRYPNDWKNAQYENETLSPIENEFFQKIAHPILSLQGNDLPVSAFNDDGSMPTGTAKYEKHGIPYLLPKWILENCIQCNQCSFVCPHACIRPFLTESTEEKPQSFPMKPALGLDGKFFRVQVSPHDCMGCGVCAETCPAKEKALVMRPADELMPEEGENWNFAQTLPQLKVEKFARNTVKGSQFYLPLFEFSYACSGCGETSYIKLLTQLFGERLLIANATGCSSIYGGSFPTCPYTVNEEGKGPAWASSLFEDNAEFGFGMRLALDYANKKERSVWIIGGDGWAYDIGFGGLDHVLASNTNVNILVLDSEVYSNTGGQASKATPLGAVARFASAGKRKAKKDLGLMAMSYQTAYVAQVSLGANKQQFLNALTEAEHYNGPSLIIAYSPCIAHGFNMSKSVEEEKRAVDCGYWQLYRFNPQLKEEGKNPFILDSKAPTADFQNFLAGENRFASLRLQNEPLSKELFEKAEKLAKQKFLFYQRLSSLYEP
ncbi:MAG: pyruvate:ferredoxin (flavodoxin) oxidoreductase, partial [Clostridia bacterium]|nr:pyruvate:ferredoxin (flavodoxin) oxidoreductase [Clostridia bacterium]